MKATLCSLLCLFCPCTACLKLYNLAMSWGAFDLQCLDSNSRLGGRATSLEDDEGSDGDQRHKGDSNRHGDDDNCTASGWGDRGGTPGALLAEEGGKGESG